MFNKMVDQYFASKVFPLIQCGNISAVNSDGSYDVRMSGRGFSLTGVMCSIPNYVPTVGNAVTVLFTTPGDRNSAYIAGNGYSSGC